MSNIKAWHLSHTAVSDLSQKGKEFVTLVNPVPKNTFLPAYAARKSCLLPLRCQT